MDVRAPRPSRVQALARVAVATAVLVLGVAGWSAARPAPTAAYTCSVITPCYAFTMTLQGWGEADVTTSAGGLSCSIRGKFQSGACSTRFPPNYTFTISLALLPETCYSGAPPSKCSTTIDQQFTTSASGANAFTGSFYYVNQFYVAVSKTGTGTGRITSKNYVGIDCGSTCWAYLPGVMQYMIAQPDAGSMFVGWSGGGCSGTGFCGFDQTLTENLVARFDKATPPPTPTPKPTASPKPTAHPSAAPTITPTATHLPSPVSSPTAAATALPATEGPPATASPTESSAAATTAVDGSEAPSQIASEAPGASASTGPTSGSAASTFPIGLVIALVVIAGAALVIGLRVAGRRR